jgi:hypothetical protein
MSLKRLGSVAIGGLLMGALSCDSSGVTDSSFEATRIGSGSVEGAVSVDTRPLSGVTVELTGTDQRSTSTDSAGVFLFSDLPEGTYRIELTEFPPGIEFESTYRTISLSVGSRVTGFDFSGTTKQAAEIAGTVTVDGLVLPGVNVILSGTVSDSTVSDQEGAFFFRALPEGPFSVAISGFDPALFSFPALDQPVVGRSGRTELMAFQGGHVAQEGAPSEPVGLEATAADSSSITLRWSTVGGTVTRLERQLRPGGAWVQIKSFPGGVNAFADEGLRPHTDYRYRVRSCEGTACSGYSEEALATTPGSGSPNLTIAALYLTQGVQTLRGEVPVVAGRNALLRVFPTATGSNTIRPRVRIWIYRHGSLVHTETVAAPGPSVPTLIDEGDLESSWNFSVPANLVTPGVAIVAEVDPDDQISEPDESDNTFMEFGISSAMDVREVPPLDLVFVPVRQNISDRVGRISSENLGDFLDLTRKLHPIAKENTTVHAEYVSSAPTLEGEWF